MSFYIIVLSFTREFIMQKFLRPLARRSGLKSRAKQSRFMEQMYTAIYFSVLGPCGLYVMSRTPVWYFNTRGMYENFPHRTHEGIFKFYYLFQAAYWAQQAIVLMLGMEKPRKDFKELVGHHIVSLALIGLSYRFHFTYMGLGVFITHDISDFFLAVSNGIQLGNAVSLTTFRPPKPSTTSTTHSLAPISGSSSSLGSISAITSTYESSTPSSTNSKLLDLTNLIGRLNNTSAPSRTTFLPLC